VGRIILLTERDDPANLSVGMIKIGHQIVVTLMNSDGGCFEGDRKLEKKEQKL
jgi:hypothetical protein